MIEAAKKYHSFGLSVIPIAEDKCPSVNGRNYVWKKHIEGLVYPLSIFDKAYGIGLVAGKVSGNLEIIDIDCKYDLTGKLYKKLKELINETDSELLKKMVVQKTMNNGYHFIYKCKIIEGNKQLARRETTKEEKLINPKEKAKVLLETRGEGGFVACYPTPKYEIIYGSLDKIQEITEGERETILNCAKSFNQYFVPVYEKKETKEILSSNKSPFDDWNERGDVLNLLISEGWTVNHEKGARTFLLRPGGDGKWSSEYHYDKRLFYVWTSSSEFENDKAYNPVQVLTTLRFNGDYSACAKWLLQNGYGETNFKKHYIPTKQVIETINPNNLLGTIESESEWIGLAETNSIPQGFDIGSLEFDSHFRLKPKTLVGIFGIDNTGKTTFHNFLEVCYSKRHKEVNWLLIVRENTGASIRQNLIELYNGKPLHESSDEEKKEAKEFAYQRFDILEDNVDITVDNFFEVLNVLYEKKHYLVTFVDPYNSIQFEQTPNKNYSFLGQMRMFQNKYNMSFHVSMHIATDKARNYIYSNKETITTFDGQIIGVGGQMKIPRKNFVEGGQPIANKLDDIIIVHRIPKIPEIRSYTLISIDKVKEDKTGGMVSFEEPILFLKRGKHNTFVDKDLKNPLLPTQQSVIIPNKEFDQVTDDELGELYKLKDSPF